MMINVDKTKVTATCKNKHNIFINNEKLQQIRIDKITATGGYF